jgi:hypothetical protein
MRIVVTTEEELVEAFRRWHTLPTESWGTMSTEEKATKSARYMIHLLDAVNDESDLRDDAPIGV